MQEMQQGKKKEIYSKSAQFKLLCMQAKSGTQPNTLPSEIFCFHEIRILVEQRTIFAIFHHSNFQHAKAVVSSFWICWGKRISISFA